MRRPWADRTAPSESVTARRSSPERSCARSGETSRNRRAALIRAALIETRRRRILRGRRGTPCGYFTAMTSGGCGAGALLPSGGRDVLFLYEKPAGMLPVRTTTFRDGGGARAEAKLRSAWTAGGGCPYAIFGRARCPSPHGS